MKKLILAAILALAPLTALAQPGPGPAPSPWVVNGPQISYSQGCVTIPVTVTGGCKGAGTINVGGFFVNGAAVGGSVASVFGRAGAVTAQSGDYGVAQVTGAAPLASPTFTGTVTVPNGAALGAPASLTLTSAVGLPVSTGISGLGTGVAAALAAAVSGSGSICLSTGSACGGGGGSTGANPTATIGASPVNGVATTFMRSDAAPPLPATLPALSGVNLTNIPVANATGILPAANGGAGSVSGILQANGSGLVAAATLGNGLLYGSPKLSLTNTLNAQTGTSYALATTDAGAIVTGVNASAQAYTIVQATTTGFTSGYGTTLANLGTVGSSGNITLTATTSDFGNKLTTLLVSPGQVANLGSDGTNYPFTELSLPVMAADTVLGNFSGTSNYPIAGTLTTCSATTSGVSYNTSTHAFGCNANHALTNAANNFTGTQSNCITTLTAVSNVFTPDGTCNNYKLVLGATNTLANWSAGMIAGAAGTLEVDQDGTGGRTIGTYGSQLIAPGGTGTIALSIAANAKDLLSYLVLDSTHVWLAVGGLNASH